MGEIIIKDAVKREEGKIYYIDGEGNICETEMRNKKKSQE